MLRKFCNGFPLRWLTTSFRGLVGGRKTTSRRRRPIPLQLEGLECRDVPTTFSALQLDQAGQYMLELVNRDRADPVAAAARYGIDRNEGLAAGTISAAAKQPLAANDKLFQAIEGHLNVWLQSNTFWKVDGAGINPHNDLNDGTPASRISAAGYTPSFPPGPAENLVARYQTNEVADLQGMVAQLEQDLFVDSFDPNRGHRLALLNPDFQEAGVAVASGLKPPGGQYPGSNLVLAGQDFGTDYSTPAKGEANRADPSAGAFVTGVVYRDVNGNGHYDIGEGLSGNVTVAYSAVFADGVSVTGQTGVSDAGAYAVKLAPGHWTLTVSGGDLLVPQTVTVDVGTSNVKADFVASNAPVAPATPTVTGPTSATTATPPTFTWTASAGATRYDLWVDNLTTGVSQVVRQPNVLTNSYTNPTALPAGNYRVWVQAYNGNQASAWSAPMDFTVVAGDSRAALDAQLGLWSSGNVSFDWGGRKEKWLQGRSNEWYFVLPDGELYRWDNSSQATGTFVAQVGTDCYANLSLLYDANSAPLATQLHNSLGLFTSGNLDRNWGGRNEEWLQGTGGTWYFILPDGDLFQWDGSNQATGTLMGQLDPSYYMDVNKLLTA
jgi:hypothetical protein